MLDPSTIDALVAAGVTVQQLAAAIKAELAIDHEKLLERRTYERNRKRIQRSRPRDNAGQPGTTLPPCPPLDKENTPIPLKEINPPLNPPTRFNINSPKSDDFDVFWRYYPHKVGRTAAKKSFVSAIKRTDINTLLDGLSRYVITKPPDRPWCNPATWLNQGRWEDQPAPVQLSAKPLTFTQANFIHNTQLLNAAFGSKKNGTVTPLRCIEGLAEDHPQERRELGSPAIQAVSEPDRDEFNF